MNPIKPMTHIQLAAAIKESGDSAPSNAALQKLRDVLILLRHGERLDHVDRAWRGCDPPLSNSGRMQAVETGLFFARYQREKAVEQRMKGLLSMIMSSPFHRCLETAIIVNIVGFRGSLPLFVNPLLSDWLQAKVFRSAPMLRGSFEYNDEDMNIYFLPDIGGIRDELSSFFTNLAGDSVALGKNETTKEAAKEWQNYLSEWCTNHARILVWTSPSLCEELYIAITRVHHCSVEGAVNSSPPKGYETTERRKQVTEKKSKNHASFSLSGVSYPESKKDLQERCENFMMSMFTRDESVEPWDYYIPDTVIRAIRKEQKECLPTHCKSLDERRKIMGRRTADCTDTHHALLPPLHILCSTHADVVGGIVDVSCPRERLTRGMSVPYCSMTVLVRHNNYYQLISNLSGKTANCNTQRHKHDKKSGQVAQNGIQTKGTPSTELMESFSKDEQSTNWELVELGSLKAVNTQIVLRYN